MLFKIDNLIFIELLENGINNLDKHRTIVNDLNVFPVPDGDTGTNMLMTLKYGYDAIANKNDTLYKIVTNFATGTVFGARGNSGVIVSQFFKGVAEVLKDFDEVDCETFAIALSKGCESAYASVAKPVEGTILTVLKDAKNAVLKSMPLNNFDDLFDIYIKEAKASLERTPEFLPILKKAGVVDSGAAGIIYFFEGVQKFLQGEEIKSEEKSSEANVIDFSIFNKETNFEYGYCIEGLLQLKIESEKFDLQVFNKGLSKIGKSIVTILENDKLKLHVHSNIIGDITNYCQKYGEFLTIKIENMTVQNIQLSENELEDKKILFDAEAQKSEFAVVAVANNAFMQQRLFEIGADVVIKSEVAPSAQEFIDAFAHANSKRILVFPNSSNSILTSMKAGSLYKKANVTVLNCRSIVECYASLLMIDFDDTIENAVMSVNDTISNIYQLSIFQATKDIKFDKKTVKENEFFALSNNKILNKGNTLEAITLDTIKDVLHSNDYSVVTLYYGKNVSNEYIDFIMELINSADLGAEVACVSTKEVLYSLTITFE
ncbi:MAG: DAK2 domain-containing protein [Bacilli bacterium]|nr:DAK2 domain-containing protein [Bacilli bacterium]